MRRDENDKWRRRKREEERGGKRDLNGKGERKHHRFIEWDKAQTTGG